jgi:putative flippase GtrA
LASRFARALIALYRQLIRTALKFGMVGLVCYGIDVGIFNLLRLGMLGNEHFFQGPIGAKIASVTISTLASWFGNRLWTFREDRRKNVALELLEFSAIAVVGMGISLLCLYISHYLLGFNTLLADNISTNVIGLVLATAFRFLAYRFWVYGHHRSDGLAARTARAENPISTTSADL